jgi:hypothetical protein
MKSTAAVIAASAVVGLLLVVRADTPWFAPEVEDVFSAVSPVVNLFPGQFLTITTVPAGRHFVVTEFQGYSANATGATFLALKQRNSSGAETLKLPYPMMTNWAAHIPGQGIVFDPGTDVIFEVDPTAGAAQNIGYLLTGYFTSH